MAIRTELELSTRGFNANLDAATRRVKSRASEMRSVSMGVGDSLGSQVSSSFAMIARSIGPAAVAYGSFRLAVDSAKESMKRQQIEMALAGVTADNLTEQLERLDESAKLPGLNFDTIVRGSTRLQAVGFTAKEAEKTIKEFANALALVGGGPEELDGVLLAVTQIAAKGKVSAEEINQIAERMPQIRTLMQDAFGTADTEVIQKMEIGSREFLAKIVEAAGELNRASETESVALKNLGDQWKGLLADLGKDTQDLRQDLYQGLSDAVERARELYKVAKDAGEKVAFDIALNFQGLSTEEMQMARRFYLEDKAPKVEMPRPIETETDKPWWRPITIFETIEEYRRDLMRRKNEDPADAAGSGRTLAEIEAEKARSEKEKADKDAEEADRRRATNERRFEEYGRSQNEKFTRERQAEQEKIDTLRSETEQGRFDLMDPAGQAAYLRNQLAASLGIPAGSTDQIEASLQSMRDLADDLQAEGDVSGEAEVRQKLIEAQGQYGRLRALTRGMDGGAESAVELGSVARLFNQVMGRDPQQQAVEEMRKANRIGEEQRDKLDLILGKMDEPPPTSVFSGPGWSGR